MKKMNAIIGSFFIIFITLTQFQQAHASSADAQMANEILMYINQYRASHGLSKLTMDPALSEEATIHSREMARHVQPFGHNGFHNRIDRLHRRIPQSSSGAENVAYNYKTAKIVAEGWLHSPGHRQNIMGHYNITGIGIVRDNQGRPYFTQMFLRTDDHIVAVANRNVHARPSFAEQRRYHTRG